MNSPLHPITLITKVNIDHKFLLSMVRLLPALCFTIAYDFTASIYFLETPELRDNVRVVPKKLRLWTSSHWRFRVVYRIQPNTEAL